MWVRRKENQDHQCQTGFGGGKTGAGSANKEITAISVRRTVNMYMLIEVMEREISEPEYFDTHDAAHDEMCRRVAEVYDISPDEVKESYLEGEDLNENAVVLEDIAWAERYGKNFDWKIFAIERDTPAQVTAPPLFNTLR